MILELLQEWSKKKLFLTLTAMLVGVAVLNAYTKKSPDPQQEHIEPPLTLERCTAKLESLKHELKVAIDYKTRTDKLLASAQNFHKADWNHIMNVMVTCFPMTQQYIACQNRIDVLTMKCRNTRVHCNQLAKERDQLKDINKPTPTT